MELFLDYLKKFIEEVLQTDSEDYSKAQIQMLKIYDKIKEGETITVVEKALAMKAVECYCDLNFLDERKALSQADSLKVE